MKSLFIYYLQVIVLLYIFAIENDMNYKNNDYLTDILMNKIISNDIVLI
jgi:hypothetical protein